MNNKVKLINIVSIACRAGKVMSGEFVIEKALSSKNNIKLILLANDVAEATKAKYEKMAKSIGTEKEVLQNIRERLQEFSKTPELVVNKTNMDEILTRLTREYHRSTGS